MARLLSPVAIVVMGCLATARAAERPNIICVLCDDLGYGDVSCLNPQGKIRTPHFDRVAAEGMVFTDATLVRQCARPRATA